MESLPLISDYVRVRVGYAILPSLAVVHLGARVCFATHLTEGVCVCMCLCVCVCVCVSVLCLLLLQISLVGGVLVRRV